MVFTRGRTASRRLQIEWDVPVYAAEAAVGGTQARLTRAAALRFIRGEDPRPLLVMRECQLCEGTDFALLRRAATNERTQLLTRWFHCVRLPSTIAHASHPLHAVFGELSQGRARLPHLFFATADGAAVESLPGNLPPSAVWKRMTKILRLAYRREPGAAVTGLLKILDGFDQVDAAERELRVQAHRALETHGPRSSRYRKLQKKLQGCAAQRLGLLERERRLLDLRLKR